jgi:aminopeptidase N
VLDRWRVPNDNFDRHTYEKGAAVLHMLRFVVGDEAFFSGIRGFLRAHAFGSVDTRQLQQAVEEASGQSLGWFFDEWLYSPGHPVLDVSSAWDGPARKLRLRDRPVQDTSKGVPTYRMPVLIAISTAAGKRVERVWLTSTAEEFEWPLAEEPLMVRFDEGNHLLAEWRMAKSEGELLYQLDGPGPQASWRPGAATSRCPPRWPGPRCSTPRGPGDGRRWRPSDRGSGSRTRRG